MTSERVTQAVHDFYAFMTPEATIPQMRQRFDEQMTLVGLPDGLTIEEGEISGIPGRWFRPVGEVNRTLLYLHGSGYIAGSSISHGPLAAYLAAEAGAEAFVPDYRLAPEHPFPAARDDALAVLRQLSVDHGPTRIVVAGESAGGGLVLSTLLAARDAGDEMPSAAVVMSPWTDMTQSSGSLDTRAHLDPFVTREQLDVSAGAYLGEHPAVDPAVSAAFADFESLPPMLLQVGTDEVLFDDTMRVADAVTAVGGSVTVAIQEGMPHAHQLMIGWLPEALEAIGQAAAFIRALPATA